MSTLSHFALLAGYNTWVNAKVYQAASTLSAQELAQNRGAFFGSILGTMNHLVVADTFWLKRFADNCAENATLDWLRQQPTPSALNQILFEDFAALKKHRSQLDVLIENWIADLTNSDLEKILIYRNTRGEAKQKNFAKILLHFFNHQTHHRGQLSTLLFQAGVDVGETDLIGLIPDVPV